MEGFPPKKEDKTQKFDEGFLKKRHSILKDWMKRLVDGRAAIFANKFAQSEFTRFIAPVQLGDKKGPNFMLPFKLEL